MVRVARGLRARVRGAGAKTSDVRTERIVEEEEEGAAAEEAAKEEVGGPRAVVALALALVLVCR